ncbi:MULTISPECIES: hypothetical protein [Bacteroides]|uniref:hypothetical protein n=1 Tax=Bacteroides TaxID=816 RepID=UPI001E372D40|nr:hypothetical protein [Bacteroides stercoris]MCS3038486.1 hypothetical protein [Bacteroides stercoris]MDC7131583.1 hypothetical protein [Bacteroides stercoris]
MHASYDYLPLADYQAVGKAFLILYWDSHSHFCLVCVTPLWEQQAPMPSYAIGHGPSKN